MGKVIDLGSSKIDLGIFFALELHSSQVLRSLSITCNLINMESWTCCLCKVTFSCLLEERGFLGQTCCLSKDADYFFPKSTVAVRTETSFPLLLVQDQCICLVL